MTLLLIIAISSLVIGAVFYWKIWKEDRAEAYEVYGYFFGYVVFWMVGCLSSTFYLFEYAWWVNTLIGLLAWAVTAFIMFIVMAKN